MKHVTNRDLAVTLHYVFMIIPYLVAGFTIWLGYHLFILGVTGEASLVVNTVTVKGQLLNAAPGLFFVLAGIIVIVVRIRTDVDIHIK